MKIPELLAPAGGRAQLQAAVENGADAVYMGTRAFNARMNAENFGGDELAEAIGYAHVRGAEIYVAMNTLVSDDEMRDAIEQAQGAYRAGADALILQDIGLAARIRERFPDLPIHYSTQGTVFNVEGVRAAEAMGFSRIILARELCVNEIDAICRQAKAEIEVFAHGALCICYSGQCGLSQAIGGRSGNRGTCAQPCRLRYDLVRTGEDGRQAVLAKDACLLSPKDLASAELVGQLAGAGVTSIKIEGRMKSPEYVAIVTRIYRKYLDLLSGQTSAADEGSVKQDIYKGRVSVDEADRRALEQIFSRGPFSAGYLDGKPGRALMSGDFPKHQGRPVGRVKSAMPDKKLVEIVLSDKLAIGDGVEIMNRELPGNLVTFMRRGAEKIDAGGRGDTVTIGYISGRIRPGDPVNRITDKAQLKEARSTYEGRFARRAPLGAVFTLQSGRPACLILEDADGRQVERCGTVLPEPAVHRETDAETAAGQIRKTGSTPFEIGPIDFNIQPGLTIPASEINAIRRDALEAMALARMDRYPERKATAAAPMTMPGGSRATGSRSLPERSLYFHRIGAAGGMLVNDAFLRDRYRADRIYLPFECFLEPLYSDIIKDYADRGVRMIPVIPAITRGLQDERLRAEAPCLLEHGYASGICAGNLGWAKRFADLGASVMGDYGLNLYNSDSFMQIRGLGLAGGVISHELAAESACRMDFGESAAEYAVYGHLPVMVSEHCIIGDFCGSGAGGSDCGACRRNAFSLTDRKGKSYPILPDRDSCRMMILSADRRNETHLSNMLSRSGIGILRVYIYKEHAAAIDKL